MPKIAYIEKSFQDKTLRIIERANAIIADYDRQGYSLTLRQLYYQLVAANVIPNTQASYARLSGIICDARNAGMIDWLAIEDRTRNLRALSHWADGAEIVASAAQSFRLDKWAPQPYRIECWVEKDALIDVVGRACNRLDMPYFACRGYTSASELWQAGQRFAKYRADGQKAVLLHFGDHDPSGLDMTRDIVDRLAMFAGYSVDVVRLALNHSQVQQYSLPPNPAKEADTRSSGYLAQFGRQSWELDALPPNVIDNLISVAVVQYIDPVSWAESEAAEKAERTQLRKLAQTWGDL